MKRFTEDDGVLGSVAGVGRACVRRRSGRRRGSAPRRAGSPLSHRRAGTRARRCAPWPPASWSCPGRCRPPAVLVRVGTPGFGNLQQSHQGFQRIKAAGVVGSARNSAATCCRRRQSPASRRAARRAAPRAPATPGGQRLPVEGVSSAASAGVVQRLAPLHLLHQEGRRHRGVVLKPGRRRPRSSPGRRGAGAGPSGAGRPR